MKCSACRLLAGPLVCAKLARQARVRANAHIMRWAHSVPISIMSRIHCSLRVGKNPLHFYLNVVLNVAIPSNKECAEGSPGT